MKAYHARHLLAFAETIGDGLPVFALCIGKHGCKGYLSSHGFKDLLTAVIIYILDGVSIAITSVPRNNLK